MKIKGALFIDMNYLSLDIKPVLIYMCDRFLLKFWAGNAIYEALFKCHYM